jgi:hypothetical protein
MLKKIYIFNLLFLVLSSSFYLTLAENLKEPNVSGTFYPGTKEDLMAMVDSFLEKAEPNAIKGKIIALISPHAGYQYSGQVAAYGYKALKYENFDTVIIVASSHYMRFDGFSIYPEGSFLTPLGKVEIDDELAKRIMSKSKKINFKPEVFDKEHSLEVQLPFLQRTFFDFKIVPIMTGDFNYENCQILANAISTSIGNRKKVLLVASTDLSHYYPYAKAKGIDMMDIEAIKKMDPQTLFSKIKAGKIEMCGAQAVVATMLAAKQMGADAASLLRYANSGDVTLDKSRVVGYASIALFKPNEERKEENMLNEKQREKLLEIARESISFYMKNKRLPDIEVEDKILKQEKGAFVTLTIDGQLRGCIGRIVADTPLYKTISSMAVESAFGDPRFRELSKNELERVKIEISVLSPLKKIDSLEEIEVGKHGLMIRKGFNSGLLLPQVATDYGWSRKEFLENVCYKAGLDKDAYKENADIYIFSAEVFGEPH